MLHKQPNFLASCIVLAMNYYQIFHYWKLSVLSPTAILPVSLLSSADSFCFSLMLPWKLLLQARVYHFQHRSTVSETCKRGLYQLQSLDTEFWWHLLTLRSSQWSESGFLELQLRNRWVHDSANCSLSGTRFNCIRLNEQMRNDCGFLFEYGCPNILFF